MFVTSCLKRIILTLVLSTALTGPSVAIGGPSPATVPQGFADMVAPLVPAVVNISTTTVVRGRTGTDLGQSLDLPYSKGSPWRIFLRNSLIVRNRKVLEILLPWDQDSSLILRGIS